MPSCYGPAMTEPTLESMVAAGMSDPAIATRLGISARTVLRRRKAAGLASRWTPEEAPCGTAAAYRRGCRCEDCRAANAAYQRDYQRRLADLTPRTVRAEAPWTPEEDAVLLAADGTLVERSLRLGRTYNGARRRLDQLRAQGLTTL